MNLCRSLLLVLALPCLAQAGEAEVHARAVAWLAKQQNENGSFGRIPRMAEQGELGITGLTLKALAGAPAELRKEQATVIQRAVAWVLSQQQKDGSFTQPRSGMATYRTSIAILALAAVDKEAHKEAINRAAAYLKGSQHSEDTKVGKDDPAYGGFGYGGGRGGKSSDLSNTAMALAALREAGIGPEDPVFKRAMVFLSRTQNSSETNPGVGKLKPKEDGGFLYSAEAKRNKDGVKNADGTESFDSYASMTYAGLMSLGYTGLKDEDPRVKAALGWIARNYTLDENYGLGTRSKDPKANQEGLYYYYYVFGRCMGARGERSLETKDGPRVWAKDLFAALAKRQQKEGYFVNSNPRWWEGDKTLATAFAVTAMNEARPYLEAKK